MGSMGISRCARLHGSSVYFLTNYPEPEGDPTALVVEYPTHGTFEPYGFSGATKVPGHPTFPYGIAVD